MVSFDWTKLVGLKGCTSTAALELAVIVAEHTEPLHFTALTFFYCPLQSRQQVRFFFVIVFNTKALHYANFQIFIFPPRLQWRRFA